MSSLDSNPPTPRITFESYLNIFARRKLAFAAVFLLVTAVGVWVSSRIPRTFQGLASFRIRLPAEPLQLNSSSSANQKNLDLDAEALEAQVEEMQRGEFLGRVFDAARVGGSERLKVASTEGGLITMQATGGSAKSIERILNTAPDLHAQAMDTRRRARLKAAIELIQDEAKKADRQVMAAERAMLPYRGSDPAAEAAARSAAGVRSAEEVAARFRETEVRKQTQLAQLTLLRARAAKEPPELVQQTESPNPQYSELQRKIADREAERKALVVDYLESSPEVQAKDQEISDLKANLRGLPPKNNDEIRTPNAKRVALESRIMEMETSLEATQVELDAMKRLQTLTGGINHPMASGEWETVTARLREEVDASRGLRAQLNGRLRALHLAEGSLRPFEVDWVERPLVPQTPIAPQPQKDLVVSLALAALLATGVVFVLEFLDDRTYSPDDVERVSPLPALGEVPIIAAGDTLHIAALPANAAALESYRLVRSGISFAGIDAPVRRILVTSPSEGDGKTVTSLNLATAMALDGKRVVLIDSDLRRPSIQRILGVEAAPGISDVLAGSVSLEAALREADTPNLRILCAGSPVPDPAELLGSAAFGELVDTLSAAADVLIFDSPPCLYVADAAVLSTRTDGVVLVVRTGHTRLGEISAAEAFLNRARARILGLVYNQARGRTPYRSYAYRSGRNGQNGASLPYLNGSGNGHGPLTAAGRTPGVTNPTLPSDN